MSRRPKVVTERTEMTEKQWAKWRKETHAKIEADNAASRLEATVKRASRKPKVVAYALAYSKIGDALEPVVALSLDREDLDAAVPTYFDGAVEVLKLVPFDPDAARVLKAAERFAKALVVGDSNRGALIAETTFLRAVERRQKRGAK